MRVVERFESGSEPRRKASKALTSNMHSHTIAAKFGSGDRHGVSSCACDPRNNPAKDWRCPSILPQDFWIQKYDA